jgi:hypothetical protein
MKGSKCETLIFCLGARGSERGKLRMLDSLRLVEACSAKLFAKPEKSDLEQKNSLFVKYS